MWPASEPWHARDERDLLRSAGSDASAFGELFRRHIGAVYRYLRLRTTSSEDAADLAQDVFLRAYTALPRYRDTGAPFIVWLLRIARNLATDQQRKRRHLPLSAADALEAPDPDPEQSAIGRQASARLRQQLAGLDGEKRELVVLRFAAGLSSREIALVVGKSEAAVKKQLTRTIQALREDHDGPQ